MKQDVRLLLFQQESTLKAITDDELFPEVGNWFVQGHVPTRNAIRAIDGVDTLMRKDGVKSPVIVVLPSREALIARIPSNSAGEVSGVTYRGPVEKPQEKFVPRASALVAALLYADASEAGAPWALKIQRALGFTALWVEKEAERLIDRDWKENRTRLHDPMSAPTDRNERLAPQKLTEFAWQHVKDEYRQAFSGRPMRVADGAIEVESLGHGLICRKDQHRKDQHYLELWRAKGDVPGAVSITRTKRHMLGQLNHELDEFVRTGGQHHRSFMIVDNPGGGKSTLVKGLANARNMRVLPVNITELTRRIDLLAFFDTVVTTQAQDPDVPLLVFVDEINALLEGHTVYSSFLAPLEDGHYNRDGKSFTIQPCVWVFVGTEDLVAGKHGIYHRTAHEFQGLRALVDSRLNGRELPNSDAPVERRIGRSGINARARRLDRAQKRSDFISRLSLPPFVLNQPIPPLGGRKDIQEELDRLLGIKQDEDREHQQDELLRQVAAAVERRPPSNELRELALRLIGSHLLRRGRALERIYVGAETITSLHPDVERISLRVLKAFASLPDALTYRDLRHDLERMTNVQRGVVMWDNLPERFHNHACVPWFELDLSNLEKQSTRLCDKYAADDVTMVVVQRVLPDGELRWAGQEHLTKDSDRGGEGEQELGSTVEHGVVIEQ